MPIMHQTFLRRAAVLLVALAGAFANSAVAPGRAQSPPDPSIGRVGKQSINVDGVTRWFIAERPPSVAANAPLVILLHGGGGNMSQALDRPFGQDWRRLADQHAFMLVAPNGTNARTGKTNARRQHWNDHREPADGAGSSLNDVQFILALIDWAAKAHAIDKSRVFVTGASNGGMMTYRLLAEAPEAFAGGAAFIANLPTATPPGLALGKAVPIMIVNGTDDPLMKWQGGKVGKRGQQDTVLSASATRDWWIRRNNAAKTPVAKRQLPDRAPDDKCRLWVDDYPANAGGADVRFVTMEGGGHAPPSRANKTKQRRLERRLIGTKCRDANGADLAWRFFTGAG